MGQLLDLISKRKSQKHAIEQGVMMHAKMQHIVIGDKCNQGDPELIEKIKSKPELISYFNPTSRVEAPIAGRIKGKFISRRIDRLVINDDTKSIVFLDYKTDLDKNALRDKYIIQMREYAQLLGDIYPDYRISGLILWLTDFTLEKIY